MAYSPWVPVVVVKVVWVSTLTMETAASGMPAPVGSVMVPVMRLEVVWAETSTQRVRASSRVFTDEIPFDASAQLTQCGRGYDEFGIGEIGERLVGGKTQKGKWAADERR